MATMKLGATLNGFTIVTPPSNDNAGMSQWCHVERDGERFFMKMYLAPKYPTPSSPGTPEGKERRRKECEQFERRHLTIAHRLKGDAPGGGGGHLVTTLAFFRVGPSYFKVTRLVDVDHRVNLIEQDPETRSIALRSLLFSVRLLHDQGIVHGDLKPDNVLFQRTPAGAITSKLIDFDEAYLTGEPPDVMHIVGDPLYYSPEMFRYVKQDGTVTPSDMTLASDIFSLGVLIHVLLTGDLPYFDTVRLSYPCEAVASGEPLVLRETLPVGTVRQILTGMLAADPTERPDINAVIAAFRADEIRAAAEGAMPELTRAEVVAMQRLRERAAVSPGGGIAGVPSSAERSNGETTAASPSVAVEDEEAIDLTSDEHTVKEPEPVVAARIPTEELWLVPERAVPPPVAATDTAPSGTRSPAPPAAGGGESGGRLRSTFTKPDDSADPSDDPDSDKS